MLEERSGSPEPEKPFEEIFAELCINRAKANHAAGELWPGAHDPISETTRRLPAEIARNMTNALVEEILKTPAAERETLLNRVSLIIKNNSLYVTQSKLDFGLFATSALLKALEIAETKNPAG